MKEYWKLRHAMNSRQENELKLLTKTQFYIIIKTKQYYY